MRTNARRIDSFPRDLEEIPSTMVFGPVPSRRLGRSLGINNIPPKHCTYSCTYCQVGRTTHAEIERRPFYAPVDILRAVELRLAEIREPVDYLTFVPDGEPTLDVHLGRTIRLLRLLHMPVAVISNASLISRADVREDLMAADWVSLKVDTVDEHTWRRLNRPARALDLSAILSGMIDFAEVYSGILTTETMLVAGVNDGETQVRELAAFLARLHPDKAYLSIPIRPPVEPDVRAADEASVSRAYDLVSARVTQVECLTGYEGDAFACSGDLKKDLLSIAAVHPLHREAVQALCARDHADWSQVEALTQGGQLAEVHYRDRTFYSRKWNNERRRCP